MLAMAPAVVRSYTHRLARLQCEGVQRNPLTSQHRHHCTKVRAAASRRTSVAERSDMGVAGSCRRWQRFNDMHALDARAVLQIDSAEISLLCG